MKKIFLPVLFLFLCGYVTAQNVAFSISKDTKVIFSKGNVQYHPKKNLWRFAPNQYDVIGEKNAKVSPSYNGWIDLFGWGTGNQPCLIADNYKDYSNFVDWGTNFAEDANWRTLTQKEWRYLLLERENASKLLGIGKVEGILGLLILPDDVNVSNLEVDFISLADQSVEKRWRSYSFSNELELNNYTKKQWELLESKGVVFLPSSGKCDMKIVEQIGVAGYYWTSETEPTSPFGSYGVMISNKHLSFAQPILKQVGCAVRLVINVE